MNDDTNELFVPVCLATILVVDDMILNMTVLTKGLENDFNVVCLESGEATLDYLENNPKPSLIVLDVMMPGLSGYDVCREIKSNPRLASIPVIFITAITSKKDEELALSIGAADFITKPVDIHIAIARIKTHLNLQRKINLLENLSLLDKSLHVPNVQYFEYYIQRTWKKIYTNNFFLGLSFTTVLIKDEEILTFPSNCLAKIAEILWRSCVFPGGVICYIGRSIFGTIIPCDRLETIIEINRGMQHYLLSQVQQELKITPGDLKISTGLAITRHNDEKFPTSLRNTAEKIHNQAISRQGSNFIFEVIN